MIDKKTKKYVELVRKHDKLFNRLPISKSYTAEERQMLAFRLTELHFGSQHIVRVIKKISETKLKFTEDNLDSLLGNLVELRIEIYDAMADWIKDLKTPLKKMIREIDSLVGEKNGTAEARKIIRSSTKQAEDLMKKIEYYYPRKKIKNQE